MEDEAVASMVGEQTTACAKLLEELPTPSAQDIMEKHAKKGKLDEDQIKPVEEEEEEEEGEEEDGEEEEEEKEVLAFSQLPACKKLYAMWVKVKGCYKFWEKDAFKNAFDNVDKDRISNNS